jgi:hypothetical protein
MLNIIHPFACGYADGGAIKKRRWPGSGYVVKIILCDEDRAAKYVWQTGCGQKRPWVITGIHFGAGPP